MTIRSLRRRDPAYPRLLAQIPDPPPRLWLRGDADVALLERPALAIVGARACSGYGRSVARLLASESAAAGAVVVSGLARGIDGEAHRGAIATGTTVAVLGCGVDRDYPAAHAELARSILDSGGLVVSEYEPGVEPAPWRFPARKRKTPAAMRKRLETVVAAAVAAVKCCARVVPVWPRGRLPTTSVRRPLGQVVAMLLAELAPDLDHLRLVLAKQRDYKRRRAYSW